MMRMAQRVVAVLELRVTGFSRSTDNTVLNITMNNNTMPCVTSIKILGVLFDKTLSWNSKDQIKHVHNKVTPNPYLLQQIKRLLPTNAKTNYL